MRTLRWTAGLLLCAGLVAQDECTHTKAVRIPGDFDLSGVQNCPGSSFTIGGGSISMGAGQCPLAMVYVPEHHDEVPNKGTKVRVVSNQLSATITHYICHRDYLFGLIPLGSSSCTPLSTQTLQGSALRLLSMAPCIDYGIAP